MKKALLTIITLAILAGCQVKAQSFEHTGFWMGWDNNENVFVTPHQLVTDERFTPHTTELIDLWEVEQGEQWEEKKQQTIDYVKLHRAENKAW